MTENIRTQDKDFRVFYYPNTLNVDHLLKTIEVRSKYNIDKLDKQKLILVQVLDMLVEAKDNHKDKYGDKDGGWFRFNSEVARKQLRDYRPYVTALEEYGVIEINDSYSTVNNESKTYRFSGKYDVNEYLEHTDWTISRKNKKQSKKEISTDVSLESQSDSEIQGEAAPVPKDVEQNDESLGESVSDNETPSVQEVDSSNNLVEYGAIPLLKKDFLKLSVDMDKAMRIINELYPDTKENQRKRSQKLKKLSKFGYGVIHTWNRKQRGGRLSTSLTNFDKNLRPALLLNGKPLVEIDVSHSVPVAGLVFFIGGGEDDEMTNRILREVINRLKNIKDININYSSIMWAKKQLQGKEDVIQYEKDVMAAQLYNKLEIEYKRLTGRNMDRITMKRLVSSMFNTPPFMNKNNKLWIAFSNLYPSIANQVNIINKELVTTKDGKGLNKRKEGDARPTYGAVATHVEALLILDAVVWQLKTDNDMSIVTLHDAIYVTEEHVDKVVSMIQKKYSHFFGVPPSVKFTYYGKETS